MANIDTSNLILGAVFGPPSPADKRDYVTIDSRSGGTSVRDGAGIIAKLQIREPLGQPQGLYATVQKPTDDFSIPNWQLLSAIPGKPYSVDPAEIYIVNGNPAVCFFVEVSNGDSTQSKHACYLTGFTPVLPNTNSGGGSGGGVSIADVQAWLVHQVGLTG